MNRLDDAIANPKAKVFCPLVPEVVHHQVVLRQVEPNATAFQGLFHHHLAPAVLGGPRHSSSFGTEAPAENAKKARASPFKA